MKCQREGCKAAALRNGGSGFCYWHDKRPEIVEKRLQGQRRGGRRGSMPTEGPVESLEDVRRLLAEVLTELCQKKLSRDEVYRIRSIAYLAGVLTRVIEVTELEARIQRLEERNFVT